MVMNPELQPVIPTPERPAPVPNPENTGNHLPSSPEIIQPGLERGAETKEATAEARAIASDTAVVVPTVGGGIGPSIPTPSLNIPTQDELDAADENEIEKEWVDRTKKIIATTKGDPYQREKQIVDVREEYQKKRFNRTKGESNQQG